MRCRLLGICHQYYFILQTLRPIILICYYREIPTLEFSDDLRLISTGLPQVLRPVIHLWLIYSVFV